MATIDAGANPDELENLARRLGQTADTIGSMRRSLNSQIMTSPWGGRTAERFRQSWNSEHHRAFADAIAFLNAGESELLRNAREQRRASSVVGSASRSNHLSNGGLVDRVLPDVRRWIDRINGTAVVVSALTFAGSNRAIIGRYSKAWSDLIKSKPFGIKNLLHFKRSPTLRAIHRFTAPFSTQLSRLARGLRVLPYVDVGLTYVDVGLSGASAVRNWQAGEQFKATADVADMTSSMVKASSKSPLTYLVGVNIATWTEVARAAREVDWSPQGLRYIRSASLSDWGQALGESMRQMPGKLRKIFG